jgi:hypothetical protein
MGALAAPVTALTALGVVAHARSRGELRALEALGAPPWRVAGWAGLPAAGAGLLGLLALLSSWADVASLFPVVRPVADWVVDVQRGVATASGISVAADGEIALLGAVPMPPEGPGRLAALACVGPIAVLASSWAITPMPVSVRVLTATATAVATIVMLHLVAAGHVPALAGTGVGLPLLAATMVRRSR